MGSGHGRTEERSRENPEIVPLSLLMCSVIWFFRFGLVGLGWVFLQQCYLPNYFWLTLILKFVCLPGHRHSLQLKWETETQGVPYPPLPPLA